MCGSGRFATRRGRHIGLFLHDNFARPGKQSGAWSSRYRDQENLDEPVAPIVVNNNNFARGEPTLLSFDDARTLFHEFGHGLHVLLSRVRYRSQSGTAVRRDFVEFPSQIFEHWMSAPETLRTYARHYQTGEPMPEELLRRLIAARNFNQGFATVEYTASALIDLELHCKTAPEPFEAAGFEREFLDRMGVPKEIGLRHRLPHFQHLFAGGGYAAGYYAYLWAEVLEADGFAAFAEAGNVFDPELAATAERDLQRRRHARPDGVVSRVSRRRTDHHGAVGAARAVGFASRLTGKAMAMPWPYRAVPPCR